MKKRVKIVSLGLMLWIITFIVGAVGFIIFETEAETPNGLIWISAIKAFVLGIGLVLALLLVYRDTGQEYKRTAWEAGIAWYVILLMMDLIVLVVLFGLKLEFWFPLIFSNFIVLIIPIVVGYLLAGPKTKFGKE